MPEEGCDPVGSPTLGQAPARTCGHVERRAHAGAGLLAGLVTPWGTHHLEQPVPEDCTLWEGHTLGQFVKSCSPLEEFTLEKFVENCLP